MESQWWYDAQAIRMVLQPLQFKPIKMQVLVVTYMVRYGSATTVGHGLGVEPECYISKSRGTQ